MKVSVIGGTGLLGRSLVPMLEEAGHDVLVSSRSASGEGRVTADFASGEGIAGAVEEADVVVHLVSDVFKTRQTDIQGTRRLLEVLEDQHLIYVSIVGVDRHPYRYYRVKYQVEQMIASSGKGHTILRATQFHDFLAFFLRQLTRPPVAMVPGGFRFQPIDTGQVAVRLSELVEARPEGLQPDLAGPEIHDVEHLTRTFMTAVGRERPLVRLPMPGKVAAAFRAGAHTNPEAAAPGPTWEDFLARFSLEDAPPY